MGTTLDPRRYAEECVAMPTAETADRHLPQRIDAEARHDRIHNSKKPERHSAFGWCIHT